MDFVSWLRAQLDRVAAVVTVAVGGVALLLGYLGVRDELYPAGQLPYIASGGIVGLALIAIGSTFWLSADLRDEWRELDEILDLLVELTPSRTEVSDATSAPTSVASDAEQPAQPPAATIAARPVARTSARNRSTPIARAAEGRG